jgi:hypothetical protein
LQWWRAAAVRLPAEPEKKKEEKEGFHHYWHANNLIFCACFCEGGNYPWDFRCVKTQNYMSIHKSRHPPAPHTAHLGTG